MVTRNGTSAACEVAGCSGIDDGSVTGDHLFVTDNAGLGIRARRVRLRDSTVVGNLRGGVLKAFVTAEPPMLRDVACDRSYGWNSRSTVPWGVCSLDTGN